MKGSPIMNSALEGIMVHGIAWWDNTTYLVCSCTCNIQIMCSKESLVCPHVCMSLKTPRHMLHLSIAASRSFVEGWPWQAKRGTDEAFDLLPCEPCCSHSFDNGLMFCVCQAARHTYHWIKAGMQESNLLHMYKAALSTSAPVWQACNICKPLNWSGSWS